MSDEVDFLHANKYESLLQIDASIPKVPRIASLKSLYNISKKKLEMKLIFCMQINIDVSYKLISTPWVPRFLQGNTIIINGHDQVFSKYTFFFS